MRDFKFDLNVFIQKAQNKHGNNFEYSKLEYNGAFTKVKITCKKHGDFIVLLSNHLNSVNGGCAGCYKEFITNGKIQKQEIFIQKANKVHNNKYDYSKVNYINNKIKVKIICPVHGEYEQRPDMHIHRNKNGCMKCYRDSRTLTLEEFVDRSNETHNNRYDYSEVKYKNMMSKVTIICKDHGKFLQRPRNHMNGQGCRMCFLSQGNSKFETEMFDFVLIPNKEKNVRSLLKNNRELDIYLPDQKIAIECNGNYWHSELQGCDKHFHLNKTKECEEKGIQLLHIFESEWVQKPDIVKSIINSKLGLNKRIYARKCEVREVDTSVKTVFLKQNHLQGEDKSNIKLGLYYEGELVSLMTFIKSRFNKNYEWEISRFVSKIGYSIIGGASKLLTYFKRNYTPKSIITYADRRYSNGNLYKTLGFEFSHYSDPNYFYTKDYIECKSRICFQKHKLKDKLLIFDKSFTEWENMKNNGYDRIWDCGNSVWIWINT